MAEPSAQQINEPEGEQWELPPSPKLFKLSLDPSKHVELEVFGWAVTYHDRTDWADKIKISRKLSENNRRDHAWFAMRKRLPNVRRTCVQYNLHGRRTVANCFYIATNETKEEIEKAKDMNLIHKVWETILLDDEPRWYVVDDQPM